MSKLKMVTIVIASGLIISCINNNSTDKPVQAGFETTDTRQVFLTSNELVEVPISISKSIIKWRGTKFFGTGSHEGTVNFEKGKLLFSDDQLAGGEFTVDMKSIFNTDIPKDDPIPRKNLTTHLNSDFETSVFPTALFTITRIDPKADNALQITGDMTIKGITKSITINTTQVKEGEEYTTQFSFNRFDWKIGEDRSWLEKKVVDAEITLAVIIKCDVNGQRGRQKVSLNFNIACVHISNFRRYLLIEPGQLRSQAIDIPKEQKNNAYGISTPKIIITWYYPDNICYKFLCSGCQL